MGWFFLGLIFVLGIVDAWKREKLRRKYEAALERERKMRLVAESAIDALAEAWGEQFAINRYRVSEVERLLRKPTIGGLSN